METPNPKCLLRHQPFSALPIRGIKGMLWEKFTTETKSTLSRGGVGITCSQIWRRQSWQRQVKDLAHRPTGPNQLIYIQNIPRQKLPRFWLGCFGTFKTSSKLGNLLHGTYNYTENIFNELMSHVKVAPMVYPDTHRFVLPKTILSCSYLRGTR